MTAYRIRPSSAARIMQCPGSLQLSEKYPELEESPEAAEGTQAHDVCVQTLKGTPVVMLKDATEEMIEGAQMYCGDIWTTQAGVPGSNLHIESFIPCGNVHPDNGGTPDAWMFDGANDIVYLWDYKFGHGFVDARDNWQLLDYAAGISKQLQPSKTGNRKYVLTVVQPRNYHKLGPIRRWTIDEPTLRIYIDRMRERFAEAVGPEPECITGPECDYCPARHVCSTLQYGVYKAGVIAGDSIPVEMSPGAMATELQMIDRFADLLKSRASGLSQQIESMIKAGERVPGYQLERSTGRERWIDGAAGTLAMLEIDIRKTDAYVTPNRAIKAGAPAELVKQFTERPLGELKLAKSEPLLGVFK